MRKTNLAPEEIAELDETKRKDFRKGGFELMKVRDRRYAKLRARYGSARDVVMRWEHNSDDHLFELQITPYGSKETTKVVLDAEEFQKFLRWV